MEVNLVFEGLHGGDVVGHEPLGDHDKHHLSQTSDASDEPNIGHCDALVFVIFVGDLCMSISN